MSSSRNMLSETLRPAGLNAFAAMKCKKGYTPPEELPQCLEGKNGGGVYNKRVQCEPIPDYCKALAKKDHTTTQPADGHVGAELPFRCEPGYRVVEDRWSSVVAEDDSFVFAATQSCGEDGSWTPILTCTLTPAYC